LREPSEHARKKRTRLDKVGHAKQLPAAERSPKFAKVSTDSTYKPTAMYGADAQDHKQYKQ
jgi:hypothetical protein